MLNIKKKSQVSNAWENFVINGEIDNSLAPEVIRSWLRCKKYLNPFDKAPLDKLENHRIKELLEKNELLVRVATPIMEDIYLSIKGSGFSVILTDCNGYILKVIGDPHFLENSSKVHLSQGVNWNEKVKGTNAIGVVLYENRPVTIYNKEHFYRENHFLTCSAAPIFDKNANLIGVLDISGFFQSAHPHNLGTALAGARAIENRLLLLESKKNQVINSQIKKHYAKYSFENIIGESIKLKEAVKLAKKAANSDSTVLLYGESGTGKELFAHAIHNHSSRKQGPFIAINCGAIPENLIESELFGYEPGAFTGAKPQGNIGKIQLANGGTLFLDEISELPLEAQSSLLRVLQERCFTKIGGSDLIEADVRIIAATNKVLEEEIKKGKFRLDLYYRLNVINIEISPLRERKADIEILASHYLGKLGNRYHRSLIKLSPQVKKLFNEYSWPGNIRELLNVLERALHLIETTEDTILPNHLPIQIRNLSEISKNPLSLENAEINLIKSALVQAGNNITKAANLLGIGRATLYRKLEKYNLK